MTFSDIDLEKAYSLVGQFMQAWSIMENSLNGVIGASLGLSSVQREIVCSNLQFRDKVHIARTATNLMLPKDPGERFDATLKKLPNLAGRTRNMIVHNMFDVSDDGQAVMFFLTKAKGNLEFPDVRWTETDFIGEYRALSDITKALDDLKEKFEKRPPPSKLAQALAWPTLAPPLPSLEGLLSPSPEDTRDSDPETATQPKED